MGAVAAVATVATTIVGIRESKKQARAQKEQAAQAQASNVAEAARQRRSSIRQARASRAAIQASGVASGTLGGSSNVAVGAGQAGIVADNSSKLSGQLLAIGNQSAQNQIIAASQRRQATFAAISQLTTDISNIAAKSSKAA